MQYLAEFCACSINNLTYKIVNANYLKKCVKIISLIFLISLFIYYRVILLKRGFSE